MLCGLGAEPFQLELARVAGVTIATISVLFVLIERLHSRVLGMLFGSLRDIVIL